MATQTKKTTKSSKSSNDTKATTATKSAGATKTTGSTKAASTTKANSKSKTTGSTKSTSRAKSASASKPASATKTATATKAAPKSSQLNTEERKELRSSDFGIPGKREYPMPDAAHVRSAEAYFRYASAEEKPALARRIMMKAKKFGVKIESDNIQKWAKK